MIKKIVKIIINYMIKCIDMYFLREVKNLYRLSLVVIVMVGFRDFDRYVDGSMLLCTGNVNA